MEKNVATLSLPYKSFLTSHPLFKQAVQKKNLSQNGRGERTLRVFNKIDEQISYVYGVMHFLVC